MSELADRLGIARRSATSRRRRARRARASSSARRPRRPAGRGGRGHPSRVQLLDDLAGHRRAAASELTAGLTNAELTIPARPALPPRELTLVERSLEQPIGGIMPQEFEGDLAGSCSGAWICTGALFRDVNLTDVRITHAWLVNVDIDAMVDKSSSTASTSRPT